MKIKYVVSAIAACTLMSGAALADQRDQRNQSKQRSSAGSVAAGVAAAGPQGAVAGGGAASEAKQQRREMRRGRGANQQRAMSTQRCVPGTASTSTSGAAFSDRTSASAAGTTSGTASGSGTNRTSSNIDASAFTDREGSDSFVAGGSTAVAREPTRRC